MKPRQIDRNALRLLRTLRLGVERGSAPAAVFRRARERFAGRLETMGLRERGRMRDYLFVRSAIRDRAVFRRRESPPRRDFHLLIDARDGLVGTSGERLLEAAWWIGGLMLSTPDTPLYVSVFGAGTPSPPIELAGLAGWPWLGRAADGFRALAPNPAAGVAHLRRSLGATEAHAVLLTPSLPPTWVGGLARGAGGTVVLVEPTPVSCAAALPLLSVLPADAIRLALQERANLLRRACEANRVGWLHILGESPVFDSLAGTAPRADGRSS